MFELEIGSVPVNLSAALFTGDLAGGGSIFRVQNRGGQTVYRSTAPTGMAPIPGVVRGFRHPAGSDVDIVVTSGDNDDTWCWTSQGAATLVLETAV